MDPLPYKRLLLRKNKNRSRPTAIEPERGRFSNAGHHRAGIIRKTQAGKTDPVCESRAKSTNKKRDSLPTRMQI